MTKTTLKQTVQDDIISYAKSIFYAMEDGYDEAHFGPDKAAAYDEARRQIMRVAKLFGYEEPEVVMEAI
tara:strand:- start:84 stop:290 length:207 start_codon:yes stop_codon:yes gene_type:complete